MVEVCWRSLILVNCPARGKSCAGERLGALGSVKDCARAGALGDGWGTEVEATAWGAFGQDAAFSPSYALLPGVQV